MGGKLDCALSRPPENQDMLTFSALTTERLRLGIPAEHPIACQKVIHPYMLEGEQVLTLGADERVLDVRSREQAHHLGTRLARGLPDREREVGREHGQRVLRVEHAAEAGVGVGRVEDDEGRGGAQVEPEVEERQERHRHVQFTQRDDHLYA